jgi:hypothetical protein
LEIVVERAPERLRGRAGMQRFICAIFVALAAAGVSQAQGAAPYAPSDNPFQGDYALALGRPVTLRVEVAGVRLDSLTVQAPAELKAGEPVRCDVSVAGHNAGERKVELTVVLLLEDRDVKALERVALEPFKVKSGKDFNEAQKLDIGADALAAASRVYVFVQVD